MGGKTATTTQQVQIPKEVMDRYRSVNVRAEQAATQPFQAYSQDPSAFVAPLTATQQAGIQNINQAAGMTQPYFNTAAGLTLGGAQGVGPLTQQQIGYYQNPFTQSVVDATRAGLQQQQGQQLAQQQAEAIRAGAFGGDRAGIQRAQLMGQQGLATAQAIAPLYLQGYQQAVQTAMGQQGVAAQDLQRQLAAGQQLGGLGAAAQQAALQGAQAQLGAGAQQQQTEQAGLSALYNQFLQERGYPFQVAQFLANIAMGTGALSGSTTTTAQPVPFFSDLRNKRNVQVLGRDPDSGNLIIAYDDKDDLEKSEMHGSPMPPKRVGPIAQELEAQHPELVSEVGGHKIVKGLAPESMGGPVIDLPPGEYREHKADGGGLAALYAQFGSPYGPQQGMQEGPYGARAGYLKSGLNPPGRIAFQADTRQVKPVSTIMQEAMQGAGNVNAISGMFDPEKSLTGKFFNKGLAAVKGAVQGSETPSGQTIDPNAPSVYGTRYASGGLVGYADGGEVDKDDPMGAYGAQGAGIGIPTEMKQPPKLQTPGAPSSGGAGGLGAGSQLLGAAGAVNALATAGSTIAEALPALMAFLPSDERMKDNVEQVGELYDGQPVYRYNMKGSPRTQLGLVAQDVERSGHGDAVAGLGGIKMVDYKRATDVAAGLAPRQGMQAGGVPEAYREYLEEASRETGIPVHFLAAKIQQEGQFRPDARGRAGEIGMTQVLPSTARDPGFGVAPVDPEVLRGDPREQILFGARYLAGRGRAAGVEDFSDPEQVAKALRAYNAGGDPNYVRNVFRHLPQFGVDMPQGLAAYAPDNRRSEGQGAIDSAAGRPQGLGAAQQQSASERSALAGYLPIKFGTRTRETPEGKEFSSIGEFLTSRQFVQPLFEGLAGMAASPSLFAGSAALQGLGAASRAYTNLEKEMAGTAETAERTALTQAQTDMAKVQAQGASIKDFEGRLYILVRDSSGRPKWVDFNLEYQPNKDRYKFYTPTPGETIPERPSGVGRGDEGVRRGDLDRRPPQPVAGQAELATAAAPAPAPAPTRGENPFAVTDDLKERAASEARTMTAETTSSLAARQDIVAQQNKMAEQANDEKRLLVELGVLGSTPKGFVSQGVLQPYKLRIARVANDVVGSIFPRDASGQAAELFDAKDIASYDAWDKKISELSAIAARAVNQTAVESLGRMRSMYPTPEQSQGGFAKNAAEVLVQRQVAIERARFVNEYHNLIKQQNPTRYSERFSPSILQEFDRRYGDVFNQQKAALEKMLNASSGPTDPRTNRRMVDENGKQMSWFTFLQKNASRLDPEFVKQIERRFNAPGIMNYFQVGAP